MAHVQLTVPYLEGGIRSAHFFNGRVLTAEDLAADRDAQQLRRKQLGQAVGDGIVRGLRIRRATGSPSSSGTVRVTAGLAFNRKGEAVALSTDVDLELVAPEEELEPAAGLFKVCEDSTGPVGPVLPIGTGAYLLVACPASGFRERVPFLGLEDRGTATGCGSRFVVEGIVFRLVALGADSLAGVSTGRRVEIQALMAVPDTDPIETRRTSESKLRNLLAHACFGTEGMAAYARDPLGSEPGPFSEGRYGAVDALRSLGHLSDADVPLAILFWKSNGVRFIDMWAVRRRVAPASEPAGRTLPMIPRRGPETEAIFFQFQEHMDAILSTHTASELATVKARSYFGFLPPAGLLPLVSAGWPKGFVHPTFFDLVPTLGPAFLEGSWTESAVRESSRAWPLDLATGEGVALYRVRENEQAVVSPATPRPQAAMLFMRVGGTVRTSALFDVARWDYANFPNE